MSIFLTDYKHRPLEHPHKQIRLLSLSSGQDTSDQGILDIASKIFDIDVAPPFTAVSYEWGPPDEAASIRVNGGYFQIRRNLHHFLRTYAETSKDAHKTALWIDQISIHQASIQERNSQVILMAQIYSRADNVISWLGPQTKDDGWLLSSLVSSFSKEQNPSMAKRLSRSLSVLTRRSSKEGKQRPEVGLPPLKDAELHAIRALLNASYWSRHWINQEVALASRCTILFGRNYIDRSSLCRLMAEYNKAQLLPQDVTFLIDLFVFEERSWKGTVDGWVTAMRLCSISHCLDLRDKVFGIQSALPIELRIEVDYTLSAEEIFRQAFDVYVRKLAGIGAGDVALGLTSLADGMNIGPQTKLDQAGKSKALQVLEYRIVKFRLLARQGEERELLREAILSNAIEDFMLGKLPDDELKIS